MTREEYEQYAIENGLVVWSKEMSERAIKALEQEPCEKDWRFYYDHGYAQAKRDLSCEDAISRQAVYEMLDSMLDDSSDNKRNQLVSLDSIADEIAELPSVKQEPSVEFVKTEESNDNGTKYLNINVSDDEVKRNPDVVRLCSDVGILEYVKPRTGHWIKSNIPNEKYVCSECGGGCWYYDYQANVAKSRYCPNCGCRMVEPQERREGE